MTIIEADSQHLVGVNAESISTAGRLSSEQTARFCQAVPRGDIRLTCVSARCGCLPRAAISTSREWAAIGEVAPLLLAAGARLRCSRCSWSRRYTCSTSNEPSAATSVTVAPADTKRTASNRCSATDNATTTNPDLPSPTPRGEIALRLPKTDRCRALTGTELSGISWRRTPAVRLRT
jgi:hypothetical protein